MARALSVSADALVFDQVERSPGDDLLLQFEAIGQLPPEEQAIVREVLDSLIIKYQTRRWDSVRAANAPARKRASAQADKRDHQHHKHKARNLRCGPCASWTVHFRRSENPHPSIRELLIGACPCSLPNSRR